MLALYSTNKYKSNLAKGCITVKHTPSHSSVFTLNVLSPLVAQADTRQVNSVQCTHPQVRYNRPAHLTLTVPPPSGSY